MPACVSYQNELAKLLDKKKSIGGDFDSSLEGHLLGKISKLSACMLKNLNTLETAINESRDKHNALEHASFIRDKVFTAMAELRIIVDELETLIARKHWPLPVYGELLFSVI
jgi:glutamine synthetase